MTVIERYSLGTKNKNLKYNADGSLTLYAGAKSPGADKESNWLPAPSGTFSLYIRAYWAEQATIDGTWQPPKVEKVKWILRLVVNTSIRRSRLQILRIPPW
jgi:hypothetical protein